jgi:hypothetical protein
MEDNSSSRVFRLFQLSSVNLSIRYCITVRWNQYINAVVRLTTVLAETPKRGRRRRRRAIVVVV